MMELPRAFVDGVVAREGPPGKVWLDQLPQMVDDFLNRWRCETTTEPAAGGVGLVLRVRRHDATPAVLKISYPHPGNRHEADALHLWDGHGAVKLYERNDDQLAMLLERADWSTLESVNIDEATQVCGALARRLAVPAPSDLPRLSDRSEEWVHDLRLDAATMGNPLSQRAVAQALTTLIDFGQDQPETLVHGDLHFGNVVRSNRESWLVVDPKGWVGDLAFDSVTVLIGGRDSLWRSDDLNREIRRRLAIFADAAEIDRERAVRWTQARTTMEALRSRKDDEPAAQTAAYEQVAEMLSAA